MKSPCTHALKVLRHDRTVNGGPITERPRKSARSIFGIFSRKSDLIRPLGRIVRFLTVQFNEEIKRQRRFNRLRPDSSGEHRQNTPRQWICEDLATKFPRRGNFSMATGHRQPIRFFPATLAWQSDVSAEWIRLSQCSARSGCLVAISKLTVPWPKCEERWGKRASWIVFHPFRGKNRTFPIRHGKEHTLAIFPRYRTLTNYIRLTREEDI